MKIYLIIIIIITFCSSITWALKCAPQATKDEVESRVLDQITSDISSALQENLLIAYLDETTKKVKYSPRKLQSRAKKRGIGAAAKHTIIPIYFLGMSYSSLNVITSKII